MPKVYPQRLIKILILVFCITSILIIRPLPSLAAGASLYLSPASVSVETGATFDISVLVDTGGQAINAVAVDLSFPPALLQVVRPVPGSSFIAIWIVQPSFSNTKGNVHLEGGIPTPGLTSSAGNILTISFRSRGSGEARIKFGSKCKVLANDGLGTNILKSSNNTTVNIISKPPAGPVISSPIHPDQNAWYSNRSPQFTWENNLGATEMSWNYDQNPTTKPDTQAESFSTVVSTTAKGDGIWYFHLRVRAKGNWGDASHYTTQIDATPPAKFTPVIEPTRVPLDQHPVVTFMTTDATSGVDHYEVKVEALDNNDTATGFFTEQQSPYILPQLTSGKHRVTIRAFDKAGNITEGFANVTASAAIGLVNKPNFSSSLFVYLFGLLLIILLIIIIILLAIRRRRHFAYQNASYNQPATLSQNNSPPNLPRVKTIQ